jgi:hypothetical protein
VRGAQPKPQPHRNTHQDEAFPLEQLEGMPAFHVSVAQLQESSCHKQDSLDVLVPAKEVKKKTDITLLCHSKYISFQDTIVSI